MAKKLLALVLSVLMLVSLLPVSALADPVAFPGEGKTEIAADAVATVSVGEDSAYYTSFDTAFAAAKEVSTAGTDAVKATITLLDNASVTATCTVTGEDTIELDLNGYILDTDTRAIMFNIGQTAGTAGELTITDNSTEGKGKIVNNYANADYEYDGGAVAYIGGGRLYLEGGTLNGGANMEKLQRGAVYVDAGWFEMHDGMITGTTAKNGAAVYVGKWGATFVMKGGEISGNTATEKGGAVYVESPGVFWLHGGTITDNTAGTAGSGVYVENGATCSLKKAPVVNENTTDNLYLAENALLTFYNAGSATDPILLSGANVHVKLANGTGVFTDGGAMTKEFLGNFTSDDGYTVFLNDSNNAFLAEAVTVTFHPGVAGLAPEKTEQKVVKGEATALDENTTWTYANHTFLGWSENPEARTAEYADGGAYSFDEDTDLYGVWKTTTISVIFDANGGKITENGKGRDKGGWRLDQNYASHIRHAEWAGHEFLGWYFTEEDTVPVNFASFDQDSKFPTAYTYYVYAHWSENSEEPVENTYTVTLDTGLAGGSLAFANGVESPYKVAPDTFVTVIATPADGYKVAQDAATGKYCIYYYVGDDAENKTGPLGTGPLGTGNSVSASFTVTAANIKVTAEFVKDEPSEPSSAEKVAAQINAARAYVYDTYSYRGAFLTAEASGDSVTLNYHVQKVIKESSTANKFVGRDLSRLLGALYYANNDTEIGAPNVIATSDETEYKWNREGANAASNWTVNGAPDGDTIQGTNGLGTWYTQETYSDIVLTIDGVPVTINFFVDDDGAANLDSPLVAYVCAEDANAALYGLRTTFMMGDVEALGDLQQAVNNKWGENHYTVKAAQTLTLYSNNMQLTSATLLEDISFFFPSSEDYAITENTVFAYKHGDDVELLPAAKVTVADNGATVSNNVFSDYIAMEENPYVTFEVYIPDENGAYELDEDTTASLTSVYVTSEDAKLTSEQIPNIGAKDGYTWDAKWYLNEECTEVVDLTNYQITKDTTFYTKWTPIQFTIRYHQYKSDYTVNSIRDVIYTYGTKTLVWDNTADRGADPFTTDGSVELERWTYDKDLENIKVELTETVSELVTEAPADIKVPSLNFFAVWSATTYTVDTVVEPVDDAGTVEYEILSGGRIKLTATPGIGYSFDAANGFAVEDSETHDEFGTTKMSDNSAYFTAGAGLYYTATATFTPNDYTLTLPEEGEASVTVNGNAAEGDALKELHYGDAVVVTLTAPEYTIPVSSSAYYLVDGDTVVYLTPVDEVFYSTIEFTMPAYDVTVDAEYAKAVALVTWADGSELFTEFNGSEGAFAYAIDKSTATITLLADASVTEHKTVGSGKNITIDLNSYEIKADADAKRVFNVEGTLTLEGTGKVKGSYEKHTFGSTIYVENGATFNLKDDVTLYGGKVSSSAGSVFLNEKATFVMSGGAITGNIAGEDGGAVFVSKDATFTMSDGTISGNQGRNGGAVYVQTGGKFNFDGGMINANSATTNGGGVFLAEGTEGTEHALFAMTDGAYIIGNDAALGGGVYASQLTNLSIAGNVKVTGNYETDDETTANNYYLAADKIVVAGALKAQDAPSIGIMMAEPSVFTTGLNAEDASVFFSSDDSTKTVRTTDGGEGTLGQLYNITLTVVDNIGGALYVNGKDTDIKAFNEEPITVTVVPNAGYKLDTTTVTVLGTSGTKQNPSNPVISEDSITFYMVSNDVEVTAKFAKINYTVTVDPAFTEDEVLVKNVTTEGDYDTAADAVIDDEIAVQVTAPTGMVLDTLNYYFVDDDAKTLYAIEEDTFPMPAGSVTVTATFKPAEYSIIVLSYMPDDGTVAYTVNGDVKSTAQYDDEIIVTATPNGDNYVNLFIVAYLNDADADPERATAVRVPAEIEYNEDQSFKQATFYMPAADAYIVVTWTAEDTVYGNPDEEVVGLLEKAVGFDGFNNLYGAFLLKEENTVEYVIQDAVYTLVNDTNAIADDLDELLGAIYAVASDITPIIVYQGTAYYGIDGEWLSDDNEALVFDATANQIDFALNGVPVTLKITKQDYLAATTALPMIGDDHAAIVQRPITDEEIELLETAFGHYYFEHPNYQLYEETYTAFDVYVNNVLVAPAKLSKPVTLQIPFTYNGDYRLGLVHGYDFYLTDKDTTTMDGTYLYAENDLFSPFSILGTNTCEITIQNDKGYEIKGDNYGTYDKPYYFTLKVDDNYRLISVSTGSSSDYATVYDVDLDTGIITYTFTPKYGNYTLSAIVERLYKVSYELNGGAWKTDAAADEYYAYNEDFKVTDYEVEYDTKEFLGWRYGGVNYQAGADFSMPEGDVLFVAQWADTFTVTYDFNGGKIGDNAGPVVDIYTYEADAFAKLIYTVGSDAGVPKKEGLVFDGWTRDDNQPDIARDATAFQVKTDVTLKAKWAYEVTTAVIKTKQADFDKNQATYGVYYDAQVTAAVKGDLNGYPVTQYFYTVIDTETMDNDSLQAYGLSMDTYGNITGVPIKAGTVSFKVVVANADKKPISDIVPFTLVINPLAITVDHETGWGFQYYKIYGDTDAQAVTNSGRHFAFDSSRNITMLFGSGKLLDNSHKSVKLNDKTTVKMTRSTSENTITLSFTYTDASKNFDQTLAFPMKRVSGEDAGTYKIYLTDADVATANADIISNYAITIEDAFKSADKSFGKPYLFTIKQRPVELEWVGPFEFTYDGVHHAPTAKILTDLSGTSCEEPTFSYEYAYKDDPDTKLIYTINADTYTASVTGIDANYVVTPALEAKEYKINPYDISKDAVSADKIIVEYGTTIEEIKAAVVAYFTDADTVKHELAAGTDYTATKVLDNWEKDVTKNYMYDKGYVVIEGKGNFAGERNVELLVTPKAVPISWPDDSLVYNGQDRKNDVKPSIDTAYLVPGDTAVTLTPSYYVLDGDAYVVATDVKDVGYYKAVVTTLDNSRYVVKEPTGEFFFQIVPVDVYVVWTDAEPLVYNKLAHNPTPSVDGYIAESDVALVTVAIKTITKTDEDPYKVVADAIDAGLYIAEAYLVSDDAKLLANYVIHDETHAFIITPCPVTIVWTVEDSYTYNRAVQGPTAVVYGVNDDVLVDGTDYVFGVYAYDKETDEPGDEALDPGAINAGDYVAAVSVMNPNYTVPQEDIDMFARIFELLVEYLSGNMTQDQVEAELEEMEMKLTGFSFIKDFTINKAQPFGVEPEGYSTTISSSGSSVGLPLIKEGTGILSDYAVADDLAIEYTAKDGSKGDFDKDPPESTESSTYTYKIHWAVDGGDNFYSVEGDVETTITKQSGGGTPITPSTGGSGSSGSGLTMTLIDTVNGTINFQGKEVTVREKSINNGDVVKLEVKPAANYKIDRVYYTFASKYDTEVDATFVSDGLYQIAVQNASIKVYATFKPINDNDPSVGRLTISNYTNGYATCPKDFTCLLTAFDDMKDPNVWYHDGVHYCLENHIMQGFGDPYFRPFDITTRAQVVTTLWNIAGHPIATSGVVFTDVNYGDWFYDAIMWAAANNIVEGYGDGTFGPNDQVTHEQLAKIFYGYAAFYGCDVSAKADIRNMPGYENVSDWAIPYIEWAVGADICCGVNGNTSLIAAPEKANRAELATFILNFCTKVVNKPAAQQ